MMMDEDERKQPAITDDNNVEASSSTSTTTGITLIAKYGKIQHVLTNLAFSTTVLEVKILLCTMTRVLPKRQKLIGLAAASGKISDETPLSQLKTKRKSSSASPSMSFILMGTPEEDILVDPSERDDLPDVIDDFDLDFNACSTQVSFDFDFDLIGVWVWVKETDSTHPPTFIKCTNTNTNRYTVFIPY